MVISQLPRLYVDAPAKDRPLYGLLNVAEIQPATDPHVLAGMEYQPLCGGTGTTADFCVTGAAFPSKADTVNQQMRGAQPFTVFAEYDCSAPGGGWDNGQEIVKQVLEEGKAWQVERAFWTGSVAGIADVALPHLAANVAIVDSSRAFPVTLQTAAVQVTGTVPQSVTRGLGMLEEAGGDCYDGVGFVHAPPSALPALANQGIIWRDGPRLRTINGNILVAGRGYTNTGPDGSTPPFGTAWLYFTGKVFGYHGAIKTFIRESTLDKSTNTVKAIAECTYVLGWDCCHYAVLINI